ncbi:MAG: signal peptidase I, partial [Spirochaetota bacterium]
LPAPKDWDSSLPFSFNYSERLLGKDEYFIIGDSRAESNDSRYWGPVHFSQIIGKVVFRYWPLNKIRAP